MVKDNKLHLLSSSQFGNSLIIFAAMLRIVAFLFLLLFASAIAENASAQDKSEKSLFAERSLHVSVAPNGGFVIPHREEMRHLITGHSRGVAFAAALQTSGEKYWHHAFNFPSVGVELFINDLGNPSQMGVGSSAIFFIQLPLNKSEQFRQYLKPGIGLGHLSRIYHPETNSKNFAVGSKLNGAVLLEYGCEIKLADRFKIIPGIRLTHFSNAAFQKPNLGYNIPSLFVGLKWQATQRETNRESPEKPKIKNLIISSFAGFGVKENSPSSTEKYMAYTISNMLEKRLGFKSSLALGADLFYNESLINKDDELNGFVPPDTKVQIGIFGGYSLHLDRFRVIVQAGTYVLDKYKLEGFLYNRFGLRYSIGKHFEAGLHLKTHLAVADHFELGLAYRY